MTQKAQSSQLASLLDLNSQLAAVENKLARKYGSQIFDYASILSPSSEVKLNNFTTQDQTLLQEYIRLGAQVLASMDIKLQLSAEPWSDFQEVSHAIYYLRFLEARRNYAEYALFKVSTMLERKYLEKFPTVEAPSESLIIDVENGFIVNEIGELDIAATLANEANTHAIKVRFSSISEIPKLSWRMQMIHAGMTTYSLLSYFNEQQLDKLNAELANYLLSYVTNKMYSYLAKGYGQEEAKANVVSYYQKATAEVHNAELESILTNVENKTSQFLLTNLKGLDKTIIATIAEEYREVVAGMFVDGMIGPTNLYKINFRAQDKLDQYESENYNCLIDLYMLDDKGKPTEYAAETYSIELNLASRAAIFEAVTQGIVNPLYTLADYLSYN